MLPEPVLKLYKLFIPSRRDTSNILILPKFSHDFTYQSAKIWNIVSKTVINTYDPADLKITRFKKMLKNGLVKIQKLSHESDWVTENFEPESLRRL